ncbi:MAG: signal peptidase II [Clostridia bacterium]|nr:signal peptidase II [Clostridia bacterium]
MWMIVIGAIIVGVIVLDQVSKILVLNFMYEGEVILIPDVLHFTYVENRGMAFGLLSEHRWVFMVLSVVGIGLVAFYLFRYVKSTLGRVSLAMIIGGGIGNMIDRIHLGFVVDFIDFCAFDFWVWVFNIADAAVCVGAGLFMLELILELVQEIKKQKNGQGNIQQNVSSVPGQESADRKGDDNG